jgi:hypothetical protein
MHIAIWSRNNGQEVRPFQMPVSWQHTEPKRIKRHAVSSANNTQERNINIYIVTFAITSERRGTIDA